MMTPLLIEQTAHKFINRQTGHVQEYVEFARAIESLVNQEAQARIASLEKLLNESGEMIMRQAKTIEESQPTPASGIPASQSHGVEITTDMIEAAAHVNRFNNATYAQIFLEMYNVMRSSQTAPQDAQDKKDAERYRFLKAGFGDMGPEIDMHNAFVEGGEKMDSTIDAAIAASKQGKRDDRR
jgi:hypothetical protein